MTPPAKNTRPRLFLHVGPHKTGTTYLQSTLHHNRTALAARGVLYPDHEPGVSGHEWFARDLRCPEDASEPRLRDFIEQLAANPAHTVVLSAENLDRLDEDAVARCAALLTPQFDTRIVYAVRSPISWLWSAWQEKIKHGGVQEFSEHALRHIARPHTSRLLNHALLLNRYATAFGRESLHLINYDRCRAQDSLLQVFCSLIGCDAAVLAPGLLQANQAISPEDTEIIRALNHSAQQAGRAPGPQMRIAFMALDSAAAQTPAAAINTLREYFGAGTYTLDLPGARVQAFAQNSIAPYLDCVVNPPLDMDEHAPARLRVSRSRLFASPQAVAALNTLYLALEAS